MIKRKISSLCFTIVSFVLFNLQFMLSLAIAADTNLSREITVIECEYIKHAGAKRVEVHYDGNEVRLIGIAKDNKQFVIAWTKPMTEVNGRVDDYNCDGNTISITEKWAFKSVYITQVYHWNGKKLRQLKTTSSDPSSDSIDAALNEALKGNLEKAKLQLEGVMYPWNYLGCGTIEEYLKKGHRASLSMQKTKGFKKSATALENTFELMVEAYNYSDASEREIEEPVPKRWCEVFKRCEISKSKYVRALNDYGFFLQQTGRNSKAIVILQTVVSEDPGRMVAYLNLADAYWSLGNRKTALYNYRLYENLMNAAKMGGRIPARVKELLKTNPRGI